MSQKLEMISELVTRLTDLVEESLEPVLLFIFCSTGLILGTSSHAMTPEELAMADPVFSPVLSFLYLVGAILAPVYLVLKIINAYQQTKINSQKLSED